MERREVIPPFHLLNQQSLYLTVTVAEDDPPRLLLTVMLCGFVGHLNCPLYMPPLFVSVPMN